MTSVDLGLVVLSAVLHAWWSFSIKASRDPLAFNLLQQLPSVLVALAVLSLVDLRDVPGRVWLLVAGTGVAHALYLFWMSRAYQWGDLTLVYPIARSTPAFVPLVSVPLLGESISLAGGLGIAMVVGGMWLVQLGRGVGWRVLRALGVRYAYLTLAATIAYSLIDKSAMVELTDAAWRSPVPRAVVYYFLLITAHAAVFTPLALARLESGALRRAARDERWRALAAACVSFVSYGLILEALRAAPVSYVVAVRQLSVLFALGLGVLWLGERPGRARIVGAAATVSGVALISLA